MLRLKDLRKEKGVLQKELAYALNRTRACISNWEKGKTEPPIDDLLKLADFFNVTVDCLVGRECCYAKQPDKENKQYLENVLVNFFRRLPVQEQYRIIGFTQALVYTQEDDF